ncbi:hypothetical protein BKA56DRAFT_674043 [Ilyonectria sp. MPI-CAGE-AT-0026]|nr:hypothetical protein BKA56DRAFT_674043 [Ilyonectria sp. MPI-CAGE-AT-0026]
MPRAKSSRKKDDILNRFFRAHNPHDATGQDSSSERGTRGQRRSASSGDGLDIAQNAEPRVTETPNGTSVNRDTPNQTKGGGSQPQIAAVSPSEKGPFRSGLVATNMADLATEGDGVKKVSGASTICADIYPWYDHNKLFYGRKRVNFQTKLREFSEQTKKANMQRYFDKVKEKLAKECANCKSLDHKVAQCLWAPQGTIKACPVCPNNGTHLADTCETFDQLSIKEKVRLLVVSRGNMPAYNTRTSWHSYLEEYMKTPGAEMPGSFPWTPGYAKAVSGDVEQLQKELDRTGDYSRLPDDPTTLVQGTPAKFEGPPKRQLRDNEPGVRGDLSTAPEMFDDEMTDVGAILKNIARGFDQLDVESHDN